MEKEQDVQDYQQDEDNEEEGADPRGGATCGRSWAGAVDVGGMYGGVSAVGPSTAGKKEARMRDRRSICKVC